MKKILGLFSLAIINCSALYLIYSYVTVVCSTKANNIFHIPYEPSGMQLSYYFISFPLFIIVAFLSQLHCSYLELKKSLSFGIIIIWISYLILILYVDLILHFPTGNDFLYHGSLIISLFATAYIIFLTCNQLNQLIGHHKTRRTNKNK